MYSSSYRRIMFGLTLAGIVAPTLLTSSVLAQSDGASLEQNFVSPPDATRPWVYWFVMDGNFTREGITADLEAMKAAGIGGFIFMEVNQGIPQGPVKFMSPEWLKLWAHTVHEAERLGLQVTMNGSPGWSGTGGPWTKPEDSMQNVATASLNVNGPQNFSGALPQPPRRNRVSDFYRDIKVLAFPKPDGNARIAEVDQKSFFNRSGYDYRLGTRAFIPSFSTYKTLPSNEVVDAKKVIDLTGKLGADGKLNWQVPDGKWTIIRFGAINNGELTHPAPQPGLGLESDKFSKAALDAHYRDYIETLLKAVGPRKVTPTSGWNMLHIDSWEVGTQNWTPNFLAEFKRRRGYDATPYLPVLNGMVVGDNERSERFLWDWRHTCGELVVQNHIAYLRDLGRKDSFGLSIEAYDKIMSSNVSMGSAADVPMGEFWLFGSTSPDVTLGEAASEGHTTGHNIIGAEAFTSRQTEAWRGYPGAMKSLGDYAFTEGINRFVIHRYQHQPTLTQFPGMTMGPWGMHWERTQTWWDMVPSYHRYLARCQYMLRLGLPVSDICYLVPEGAPFIFHPPVAVARDEQGDQSGYRYDAIAPEILSANMTVKDGALMLPNGVSYKVLVLPERDTMTPELLQKVSDLVKAGATVVGPRPVKSPSLAGFPASDDKVRELAAALWGDCDGVKKTYHVFGKGRVIWHKSETDLSQTVSDAFGEAKWIWFNEGNPARASPVAKRSFQRTFTVDSMAQIASAWLSMTADNSFEATLNGQPVGNGNDWHRTWSFEVTGKLKPGANTLAVTTDNGTQDNGVSLPNPAGLIGNLRLTYTDGHVVNIATDDSWQSSQTATGNWSPVLVLGDSHISPWNLATATLPPEYGDFSIVRSVLQDMKLPEDFHSDGPIRFIHRHYGNDDIYFVANYTDKAVVTNNSFRVGAKVPELWDPLTGEHRALKQYSVKGDVVTVSLRFEPTQSWFVVFKSGKQDGKGRSNFPILRPVGQLTGAWQATFDPKWGGPGQVTFPRLSDWSQNADKGIHYYSGKAVYRKSFVAPKFVLETPVYLDLGTVDNLAQVKINGHNVGTLWCAPWRANLAGYLHVGTNQLEITVANLWPNRLIGDQGLPAGMRVTSTTWNPYNSKSPLLPSGLLGPVTLLQEESPQPK